MCGRFANTETRESLQASFKVMLPQPIAGGRAGDNRMPRYNISPGVDIETIIQHGDQRLIETMHWGFMSQHGQRPLINARGETIFEKPSFSGPAHNTRCLIVASGWYEWKAKQQPWYIRNADNSPMAMAGLYRTTEKGSATVVVTRAAEGDLGQIHHRAPLLLDDAGMAQWLDSSAGENSLKSLILSTDGTGLDWYPVSAEVGKVRSDHEGLITPDETHGEKPSAQMDLF